MVERKVIIHKGPVPVKTLVALIIICALVMLFPVVKNLHVHNFCSLLSDAHNPVALELNLNVLIQNAKKFK